MRYSLAHMRKSFPHACGGVSRELATKADILRLEKHMSEQEARLLKAIYNALFTFAAVIIAAVGVSVSVAVAILK